MQAGPRNAGNRRACAKTPASHTHGFARPQQQHDGRIGKASGEARQRRRIADAGLPFLLALFVAGGTAAAADIATVDSGGVGRAPSLAIGADGLPAIAYHDGSNDALLFAKCETLDCSSAILESIEDANGVYARGEYSSLRIGGNGMPVVAWYDSVGDNLAIARCANADCSGTDVLRMLVETPDDTGREAALLFGAGGRPLVAYVNTTLHAVELAICEVPSCTSVSVAGIDDDPVNSRGTGADAVPGVDGMPVIVYLDTTAGAVRVAKCLLEDCSAGTVISVLDAQVSADVGVDPSIAIGLDGHPVISYFDPDVLALKVAHCGDPACAGPVRFRLIDNNPDGDAGRYSAIAIRPDGKPVVSYQRRDLGGAGGSALRVAECSNAECTGSVRVVVIDSRPGEITGVDTEIAIGSDGGAVISYYDTTGQSLKVAKCSAQGCAGPGDRIFSDGFQ